MTQWNRHLGCNLQMVGVVSLIPTGGNFITACVRSMREGTAFTGVCLFTFVGGTPFPGQYWGTPFPCLDRQRGTHPRSGRSTLSKVQMGCTTIPGLDRGHPGQVPGLDRGWDQNWMAVPPLGLDGGTLPFRTRWGTPIPSPQSGDRAA